MKVRIILPFIAALFLPAIAQPANQVPAQHARATGPVWSINLFDLKGESLGSFTIQLLDESGNWFGESNVRKARLLQSSVRSPPFLREFATKGYFPTYRADGERLTILLSHVSDYSLSLSGTFTAREGKGNYAEWGRGFQRPLGTFTAKSWQR